ncbi:MAG: hypothetical protein ACRDBH_03525 [Bosea sp. (in: a-proteobacteria)]
MLHRNPRDQQLSEDARSAARERIRRDIASVHRQRHIAALAALVCIGVGLGLFQVLQSSGAPSPSAIVVIP